MKVDDAPYVKRENMTKTEYNARVNYWRQLFRESEFEELDDVFSRFYESCGIRIRPLKVSDNGKPHRPKLIKYRDRILRAQILERKPPVADMLVVAFWDARFSFNLGFDGYTITGIEPYKRAVEVANIAKDELLFKYRKGFRFNYGFAERLERYPKYDVIVNFCLEHVRNPKHVIEEALRHLKEDGVAYFTPPIKHGCGSAEHLHWFQDENELTSLVPPEGYSTKFDRVKFTKNAPFPNVFILEVTKC